MGLLFPIYGKKKKKHVPNHQPEFVLPKRMHKNCLSISAAEIVISPGLPGRAVKPALNAKAMPAVGVKGC